MNNRGNTTRHTLLGTGNATKGRVLPPRPGIRSGTRVTGRGASRPRAPPANPYTGPRRSGYPQKGTVNLHLKADDSERWHREEENVDYLDELTRSGWHFVSSKWNLPAGAPSTAQTDLDEDTVARRLRDKVGIYHGRQESFEYYSDATPVVLSATDIFKLEAWMPSTGWPSTPWEMKAHLRRVVIPLLQAKAYPFWDPGMAEWCAQREIPLRRVRDEKKYKEAWLHAEMWKHEDTFEELWALVALMEPQWRPPTKAIVRAVWRYVTGHDEEEDLTLRRLHRI
jgi:hypothetical protein